ncbi:hypothetical protein [Kribbella solani]|uniref:hypothetical protein n=1 Tax=Kribbella solani TaxID=236067 RepID=UPI0029A621D1|nr:hypothetical protein [Kribbella solani]MDX2972370.1 hypothetical protein [Kribbella solani]
MSPRPAPKPDDVSGKQFLDAAAQLIDAMFAASPADRPRRLQVIDFPAALQWLRIEDVVKVAQGEHDSGVSQKALHNRWTTKDEFIKAAVIHTMLYRDDPAPDPTTAEHLTAQLDDKTAPGAALIIQLADALLSALLDHPRSFLLMHIGPLLAQHPELHAEIVKRLHEPRAPWYAGYEALMMQLGVSLRPGWTIERLGMAITAMLDGFLLRSRIHPVEVEALRGHMGSLFAESLLAMILGAIDIDGSGRSVDRAFDTATESTQETL